MWQQDTAPETYTWQEALSYCENLTLASHNDWRLPNVNELQSLVDYERWYGPAINTTYFPNTQSSYPSGYWSSTTNAGDPYGACAWLVGFYYGGVGYDVKSGGYYVRAVRAGQCESLCPTESLYGEHSEQTELLRYLRDNVLSTTPEGQELIRLYYELSPVIIKMMDEDKEFKEEVKEMVDGMLIVVRGLL